MEENNEKTSEYPEKLKTKKIASPLIPTLRMSLKSKRIRQEQLKLEKEIEELANEILKKISYGIDEFNVKLPKDINLQEYIKYILNKDSRNKYQIIVLRYYLSQFSSLLETMNLSTKYFATKEILNKIAIHLKKEEITKNNIVFYNGQIGKTFYIILEGEVSVLLPNEYNLFMTMDEYLEYLKYLYKFNDYELLRLSYESNKEILKMNDYEMSTELINFDYCLDKVLQSNYQKGEITVEEYIKRFDYSDKINYEKEIENNIKNIEIKNLNNKNETEKNNSSNNESSKFEKTSNYSDNSILSNYSIVQKKDEKSKEKEKEIDESYLNNRRRYNFSLWKYVEVIKLGKGKCFGEIALQSSKSKRTATIITLSDCLFGTLEKDQYLLFVKEVMEKIRKNNIEKLLSTKLFEGVSFISFDTKLFNCFIFSKEEKGSYLFKRGDKRNYLNYIKKGEIQLEIIASCKQLDNLILLIGGNPYEKYLNNLIKTNEKLLEFINVPKKFNISIFSQGDIIGTDELVYISSNVFNIEKLYYNGNIPYKNNILSNKIEEDCFLFNAVYLTNSEIFKLDINFLKSMLKDKQIKINYEKLLKEKKERLIERLLNMKNNTILQYYNMINNNIVNTSNLNKKRISNILLNKKNMINKTQYFSLKNINNLDIRNINNVNKDNKIASLVNTRNNSFSEDISKTKGKTKDYFYPEQNTKSKNDNNDIKERSLLTSFMNNSKYKINLNQKLSLSQNNFLHNYKSEKNLEINKNRTYYNSNSPLKKISLSKNNMNFRNLITNFSINNTLHSNEDNNSSDKMSMYKSLYPMKKQKNLKLSDVVINSFKNPEIKLINNKRIPKLLMNNAIIYNTAIDKILFKRKKNIFKNPILLKNKGYNNFNTDKYNENNKIFNKLDALAFDDILNEIKSNKIGNQKKFSPILPITKNKIKFYNNVPLPRTTYNFYMKKNKKF